MEETKGLSGKTVLAEGPGHRAPPLELLCAHPIDEASMHAAHAQVRTKWPLYRTRARDRVALWVELSMDNAEHWRLRGVAFFLEE
jgi:hypothetical protein